MMKRMLSLFLCLVMVLSMVPVQAIAHFHLRYVCMKYPGLVFLCHDFSFICSRGTAETVPLYLVQSNTMALLPRLWQARRLSRASLICSSL